MNRKQTRTAFEILILKTYKNKHGFTLVEMVIATALVAIFFTMAAAVLPSWFQSYKNIIQLSYARQISNSIVAAVEDQVMFAEDVQLLSASDKKTITGRKGNTTIQIPERKADGTIQKIEGLVYDDHFFRGLDVDMEFVVEEGKYCKVIVSVKDTEGTDILEKSRSVKLAGISK